MCLISPSFPAPSLPSQCIPSPSLPEGWAVLTSGMRAAVSAPTPQVSPSLPPGAEHSPGSVFSLHWGK